MPERIHSRSEWTTSEWILSISECRKESTRGASGPRRSGFCQSPNAGKNPLAERVDHVRVDSVNLRIPERIHSRSEWTTSEWILSISEFRKESTRGASGPRWNKNRYSFPSESSYYMVRCADKLRIRVLVRGFDLNNPCAARHNHTF